MTYVCVSLSLALFAVLKRLDWKRLMIESEIAGKEKEL